MILRFADGRTIPLSAHIKETVYEAGPWWTLWHQAAFFVPGPWGNLVTVAVSEHGSRYVVWHCDNGHDYAFAIINGQVVE